MVTFSDIEAAHERIRPYIYRTPILTSRTLDSMTGASLFFKCENFQKIGAFKIRGGMNAVLSLSEQERQQGIATHSSGNHAQAVAYAAREVGVPAYIVMPENSPQPKIDAVRDYGAQITLCEATQKAREETVEAIIARTGAAFVHPYDDDRVIAGQGTCAKELIEDIGRLDVVIAPVGGGGLLSGTCISTRSLLPSAAIYAGEPAGAADAYLSLTSGVLQPAPFIKTIADGLLTKLSDRTFAIISQHVTEIITVEETEILAALKLVYERLKIVIEPSSAVPLAAIIKRPELFAGKKTGMIFSGGNIDLARLGRWFAPSS